MNAMKMTLTALALSMAAVLTAPKAEAAVALDVQFNSSRGSHGGYGGNGYYGGGNNYHRPHTDRVWVPGYHETRYEKILIAPERHDRVWVAPVYETRIDYYGRPVQILLKPGYFKEVCIPAQYDTRAVKQWVPGYYKDVPHYGSHRPNRPHINAGFSFYK